MAQWMASAMAAIAPANTSSELDEQRMRADMWFRRSGELLAELTKEKTASAAATAMAASARAEASAASREMTDLREQCNALLNAQKERSSMAIPHLHLERSDALSSPSKPQTAGTSPELEAMREELLAVQSQLQMERDERQRQAHRIEALREQVRVLSEQLEAREREHHEMAALVGAVRSCEQLSVGAVVSPAPPAKGSEAGAMAKRGSDDTPFVSSSAAASLAGRATISTELSTQPILGLSPEFVAEIPPATSNAATAQSCRRRATSSSISLSSPFVLPGAEKPIPVPSAVVAASICTAEPTANAGSAPPSTVPPASFRASLYAELHGLIHGVLTHELEHLVLQLRDAAVSHAEKACDSRVAVLETAVGELLSAMDAETHHLLLKWRGQLEATQRENRVLKEQQRVHHIQALDLNKALQNERSKAAQANVGRESHRHSPTMQKQHSRRVGRVGASEKAALGTLAGTAAPARPSGNDVAYWHPRMMAEPGGRVKRVHDASLEHEQGVAVPVAYWVW